VTHLSKS